MKTISAGEIEDAFQNWFMNYRKNHAITFSDVWRAAIKWYQSKQPKQVELVGESKANPCECGSTDYYLSPIVGARCKACNKPLTLKSPSPANQDQKDKL